MNVSSQTLLKWRQNGKQKHGDDGFEALCGIMSVYFLPCFMDRKGHHVEGERERNFIPA